ncbi:hypothetical protein HNY73_013911 [Argiope bruennichi]|uniref:Uncharacterized protein n=1 Tax=Argiope bruennichi TaxID=94029 RepID=A0A8T0EME6_ARGBR|nr:hypothetical protein HNY73_013911 [Argiope bruennichi]
MFSVHFLAHFAVLFCGVFLTWASANRKEESFFSFPGPAKPKHMGDESYSFTVKCSASKMFSPAFLIMATLLCSTFVTDVASQDSGNGSGQDTQPLFCVKIPQSTMSKMQCGVSAIQMAMKML